MNTPYPLVVLEFVIITIMVITLGATPVLFMGIIVGAAWLVLKALIDILTSIELWYHNHKARKEAETLLSDLYPDIREIKSRTFLL